MKNNSAANNRLLPEQSNPAIIEEQNSKPINIGDNVTKISQVSHLIKQTPMCHALRVEMSFGPQAVVPTNVSEGMHMEPVLTVWVQSTNCAVDLHRLDFRCLGE
jgi:hypothetical protein